MAFALFTSTDDRFIVYLSSDIAVLTAGLSSKVSEANNETDFGCGASPITIRPLSPSEHAQCNRVAGILSKSARDARAKHFAEVDRRVDEALRSEADPIAAEPAIRAAVMEDLAEDPILYEEAVRIEEKFADAVNQIGFVECPDLKKEQLHLLPMHAQRELARIITNRSVVGTLGKA